MNFFLFWLIIYRHTAQLGLFCADDLMRYTNWRRPTHRGNCLSTCLHSSRSTESPVVDTLDRLRLSDVLPSRTGGRNADTYYAHTHEHMTVITVQHGSADPVVRAMNVKYKNGVWGSCNSETPKPISIKLGISDHIAHPTPRAKFGYNRFKGACLRMREIRR